MPARVRRAAHIDDETTLVVETVGDVVMLRPADREASFLVNAFRFRREVDEAGVTLDELLAGLAGQRDRYYREEYGG